MTGIPAMQDMRWSSFPVDSHHFPKLRLKFKQNLISLAGGMTRLPVTDPKVRTAHALQSCKALSVLSKKKDCGAFDTPHVTVQGVRCMCGFLSRFGFFSLVLHYEKCSTSSSVVLSLRQWQLSCTP